MPDPTTTPYSGDPDNYPETSYLPTDATEGKAETFNVPYEALFDRTAALQEQPSKETLRPILTAAAGYEAVYEWTSYNNRFGWWQIVVTPVQMQWYVQIPPKHRVMSVTAHYIGNDGPGIHPDLPAEQPKVEIGRQAFAGGLIAYTTIADAQDTAPDLSAYEGLRAIVIDLGAGEIFPSIDQCVIGWRGEGGTDSTPFTSKLLGFELELQPDY